MPQPTNWRDLAPQLSTAQRKRLFRLEMESTQSPDATRRLLLEVATQWAARRTQRAPRTDRIAAPDAKEREPT
jgi:hypothetical protein